MQPPRGTHLVSGVSTGEDAKHSVHGDLVLAHIDLGVAWQEVEFARGRAVHRGPQRIARIAWDAARQHEHDLAVGHAEPPKCVIHEQRI